MSAENTPKNPVVMRRRHLLQAATIATGATMLGLSTSAWAGGSDKPEKTDVKIGFIPLTDCASLVMASVLGFDKKYGIKASLIK